jgi:hypothetical protein
MELTMANKSAVRIFRKHILGKGVTEHSGRGFYDMYTDLTLNEIRDNAERFYARHSDKVESLILDDGEGRLVLRLKEGYGDHAEYSFLPNGEEWYYRTLMVRIGMYGGVCATVSM